MWQPPQPALSKTFAPGSELVDELELSFPLSAAAGQGEDNEAQESHAADGRCTHAAHSSGGFHDEPSPNRQRLCFLPQGGYSLTLVGVIERQPLREARPVVARPLAGRAGPARRLVALGLVLGAISLGDLHRRRLQPRRCSGSGWAASSSRRSGSGCARDWPRIAVARPRLAAGAAALCAPALPDRALSLAGPGQLGRGRDHGPAKQYAHAARRRSVRRSAST